MAQTSIAEAFPAETRFLTSRAACQLTAINMRIVEMAKDPDTIHDDDLRQTFLEAVAVRAKSLSEVIGLLADGEEFDDPEGELRDACLQVEGVHPSHLTLPDACREAFGLTSESPIGREASHV